MTLEEKVNSLVELAEKVGLKVRYEKLVNNSTTEQGDVKWNFEKFLISREGNVVQRFRSGIEPESETLVRAVEKELSK